MNDVIDILDLGGGGGGSKVGRKKGVVKAKDNPPKRPDGMHRELYALLCADGGKNFQELAPILPTDTPGGYKKKIKLGAKKVRQWHFNLFARPGRKDRPFLRRWRRVGDGDKEYPFAKFITESSVPEYTDAEYAAHLEQEGWTKAETDHLFDLYKRFEMRFLMVQDRWDKTMRRRTLEDIKERYYYVCNILSKLRHAAGTPEPKLVHYDGDHETRRKEQLRKLWSKTPEQVEEEEFLRAEQKKIEARKKEREKKTQDLQKLITAADAGGAQTGDGGGATSAAGQNLGKKLTAEQKKGALLKKSGKTPLAIRGREGSLNSSSPDVFLGIKWPDFKTAGCFVRSQKLKLPSSVGTKKSKAIEQILQLLGLSVIHAPTEEITTQFNDLRSDIVLLYELKSALTTCEMEIHSLAHQYEASCGDNLKIPAEFLNETTSSIVRALEAPTKASAQAAILSTPPTPGTPGGSISSTLGVNDLDVVVPHRKRKAALDQANVLKKLKNKM